MKMTDFGSSYHNNTDRSTAVAAKRGDFAAAAVGIKQEEDAIFARQLQEERKNNKKNPLPEIVDLVDLDGSDDDADGYGDYHAKDEKKQDNAPLKLSKGEQKLLHHQKDVGFQVDEQVGGSERMVVVAAAAATSNFAKKVPETVDLLDMRSDDEDDPLIAQDDPLIAQNDQNEHANNKNRTKNGTCRKNPARFNVTPPVRNINIKQEQEQLGRENVLLSPVLTTSRSPSPPPPPASQATTARATSYHDRKHKKQSFTVLPQGSDEEVPNDVVFDSSRQLMISPVQEVRSASRGQKVRQQQQQQQQQQEDLLETAAISPTASTTAVGNAATSASNNCIVNNNINTNSHQQNQNITTDHFHLSSDNAYVMPEMTPTNGIRQWDSWLRVFQSPSQAFLDLIDNSLDAALKTNGNTNNNVNTNNKQKHDYYGKIHLYQLRNQATSNNGIVLINNSYRPIQPLHDVLVIYGSTKGTQHNHHKQDAIGENGIGLKHGCAALSHLSFVITRNKNILSIGILAKALQTERGICLPSFRFLIKTAAAATNASADSSNGGEQQQCHDHHHHRRKRHPYRYSTSDMMKITTEVTEHLQKIVDANPKIAHLVQNTLGEGDLRKGLELWVDYIMIVYDEAWENEDYVFNLVIPQLFHNNNNNSYNEDDDIVEAAAAVEVIPSSTNNSIRLGEDEPIENGSIPFARLTRSKGLKPTETFLHEIRDLLTKQYISIPQEGFEFYIDAADKRRKKCMVPVRFCFWIQHLVELSKVTVYVNNTTPTANLDDANWHVNGYPLSVYIGFDPLRMKELSIRIHSRKSGRLIEYDEDARGRLGVITQSSNFAQGLTMIVDDVEGMLPLMPTKQGIAWSEEKCGKVHRDNFYTWLGAVAKMYYNFHLYKFSGKKAPLANAVRAHYDSVAQYVTDADQYSVDFRCLNGADLNRYAPEWQRTVPNAKKPDRKFVIWQDRSKLDEEPYFTPGKETLFLFSEKDVKAAQPNRIGPKKRKTTRKVEREEHQGSDYPADVVASGRRRKCPRTAAAMPKTVRVTEYDDDNVDANGKHTRSGKKNLKPPSKRPLESKDEDSSTMMEATKTIMHLNDTLSRYRTDLRKSLAEVKRLRSENVDFYVLLEENENLRQNIEEKDVLIAQLTEELESRYGENHDAGDDNHDGNGNADSNDDKDDGGGKIGWQKYK